MHQEDNNVDLVLCPFYNQNDQGYCGNVDYFFSKDDADQDNIDFLDSDDKNLHYIYQKDTHPEVSYHSEKDSHKSFHHHPKYHDHIDWEINYHSKIDDEQETDLDYEYIRQDDVVLEIVYIFIEMNNQ